ncbi:MAG: DinB family protein [Dehalococcoidia bacterium]
MPILSGSRNTSGVIAELAAVPDRLARAIAPASDAALDSAPEGEWTARTVLAHLRDDEFMVMRLRLERMLVENEPELAPFDERAWAVSRNTSRDSRDDLLSDFRTQRGASVAILKTLAPDDWRRVGHQPEIGSFDIHWWLEHWLDHDNNHLAQIESALAQSR